MVCIRVLTGLLLFSLFSSGLSAEVDLKTLPKIIKFIETKYKPSGQTDSGDGVQYAVAINVPAEQCGASFNENTFLSAEDAKEVKKSLSEKNLYQGTRLVAATPTGGNSKSKIHSERALLMCDESSQAVTPVQNLLNKYKDGCVVFYTYNSPCLDYCLNQTKDDNERNREMVQRERNKKKGTTNVTPAVQKCILNSLRILTNHSGPKAFVFSQVYRKDKDKPELKSALEEVAKKVNLYKCSTTSCIKCLDQNQIFNNQCVS